MNALPQPAAMMAGSIPRAGALGWRRHLQVLAALSVLILLLFARDAADMAMLWWDSSTFTHCLLILPIIGWLVWQRVPELRQLVPVAWAPGLLIVAAGAFGWLLGQAAGVALARQLGLVVMLQGAVVACLGHAVARGLLFPLFYALFLVPAGEELVPLLQTITAKFCMAMLALVGIPAHIEGVFISTPGGYFEVAEACSGVKFLIAMVAYAVLAANVCFKSWPRRIVLLAVAVTVPILANGIRAWGTIYIASKTGIEFAAGFDHVVYGWIFFAIVLAIVMGIAWPFFDRAIDDPWIEPAKLQRPGTIRSAPRRLYLIGGAAVVIAVTPIAWSAAIAASGASTLPDRITLPEVPGWTRVAADRGPDWKPHYDNADHHLLGRYANAAGQRVDLAIVVYGDQEEGRELVGFGQGPIIPEGAWAWTARGANPPEGRADRIMGPGGVVREVLTFYRIGDVTTGNPVRVKLETLKVRLLGGPRRAVALLVAAEAPGTGRSARPAIDAFLRDLGPVAPLADRMSGLEPAR